MLSIILLLLILANGLSAARHSVYLGMLWTVLMEVLLFFLVSIPISWSLMTLKTAALCFLWSEWLFSISRSVDSKLLLLVRSSTFSVMSCVLKGWSESSTWLMTVFIESRDWKVFSSGNFRSWWSWNRNSKLNKWLCGLLPQRIQ